VLEGDLICAVLRALTSAGKGPFIDQKPQWEGKDMNRLLVIAVVFVAVAFPSQARADWPTDDQITKWVQLPDLTGWDVRITTPKIVADDFLCRETNWISDIHFWGSWLHDDVGWIDRIHLSIHSDIRADQNPLGYSMPGPELWSRDIDTATYPGVSILAYDQGLQGWYDPNLPPDQGGVIPSDHFGVWQVNVDLNREDWFLQTGTAAAPMIYWLDIQVDVSLGAGGSGCPDGTGDLVDFGWKTSIDHWNDDAVWADAIGDGISPPAEAFWNELRDPFTGESLDMAFAITTIPEPGVFAIIGMGLLSLLTLRRRK